MINGAKEAMLSFDPLIGLVPWNVMIGRGSFLTMEFGKQLSREFAGKSHVHGEWHLWLRSCAWRIEKDDQVLAASCDEQPVLTRTVEQLGFGPLSKVSISKVSDLSLTFSQNLALITFTSNRYRYEQWELFKPDGRVLIANAGGKLIEKDAGNLAT